MPEEIDYHIIGLLRFREVRIHEKCMPKTIPHMQFRINAGLHELFLRNRIEVHLVQARQDGVSFAVKNCASLPDLLRRLDNSIAASVEEKLMPSPPG